MRRPESLPQAIAPFSPMGYCALTAGVGEGSPQIWCGGDAVMGETPVTRDTLFRVASISKVIGAAAAMRLVKRNQLSLDGDICEVLGFPVQRSITLRQLLTHTAAISDRARYDAAIELPELPPLSDLLGESFLPYAPGTAFRYSNLGAGVAGMLVEKASGMLFDDFVRQEFFTPYGIDASFHPQRILRKERMANCYRMPTRELAYDARAVAARPLDNTPDPEKHYSVPAGRLMITAPDLLSVLLHLRDSDRELFAPQDHQGSVRCAVSRGVGFAFAGRGVFAKDRAFVGHQGVAYGAVCEAWLDLADGFTAILLTNGARLGAVGPLQRVGQRGIAALISAAGNSGLHSRKET